jgi:isopenicillin-N N-acyltransferase like protein
MSRLLLPFALVAFIQAPTHAGAKFVFPAGKTAKASLRHVNGLPVLVVSGTPEEIGAGVGELALKPGARVLGYPRDLLRLLKMEKTWGVFLAGGKALFKQFPADYRTELEAIARAAGADRDLVIAGNTFFDLKKVLACSSVLVGKDRSATGGPLLARNLDYPSLGYVHQYSLVTVYRPQGKHAFASVGFPGLVGCLSGINDSGLCLAVHEVCDIKEGEPHFDPRGLPYALCLRRVLEDCATIDEAQKKLESLRRTCTINVAVADRHTVAVLEVSPRRVVRRDARKSTCVCTNHFCTPALRPARPLDVEHSFERFAKLEEVRDWDRKASPDDLRKQLDAVALGRFTLQTMVFEPATLRLHLSIGKTPASAGPLRTLDLAPLLRKPKVARAD